MVVVVTVELDGRSERVSVADRGGRIYGCGASHVALIKQNLNI